MGNVKTLVQRSKMLVAADNSNGEKRIDYQYDLISGKVNRVIYQPGKGDQFIHRYDYDADNRIISVNTSRDGLIWQNDAKYVYHLHGPLARTELGDQKVQGMDYAYTLQGWLKGVNSSSLHNGLFDIGQDGKTGGSLPIVGRDAYGYMLDYYVGDYKPIGQQAFSLNTFTSPSPTPATGFKSLYNGNIGGMVTNIRQLNTPQYTYYHYDQLNRIKRMEALHGQNASANTWNTPIRFNGYIESFTYDPNGNIMTLSRNSNVQQIDDLTYNYLAGTNKLTSVTDPIAAGLVNYDIDGQGANNYSYDRIGNMTADNAEGITGISWTVYGKIKQITKSNGTIEYRYDASGNRIYKKTVISGATTETYYARDAQGNVMAVYEKQAANPLKWMEQHLYGSSRLGMWNLADVVPGTTIPASGGTVEDSYLYGSKLFELSNHLGNVLVTVSDKKIGIDDGGNGTTDYFQPEVLTAQDYYSFGMAMPGRKFTRVGGSAYRYGFNGKENDNDVKGEGNQQDYGMRIYDPRVGRFLSIDPLTSKFPNLTPYQFASNTPVQAIDLDGLESVNVNTNQVDNTLNANSCATYQNNNDYTPWKDLIEFKPLKSTIKAAQNRVSWLQLQPIEKAFGPQLNLDYYSITITKLPGKFESVEAFLSFFREKINEFAKGSNAEFEQYNEAEGQIWFSRSPLSSVMRFQINDPVYNTDDASVLTSKYSSNYWIFSPVFTFNDFGHPVSGNRQFGVVDNQDNTFTFFTRGADRIHAPVDQRIGGQKVFDGADKLWRTTMLNVVNYINLNGGSATENPHISKRIDWQTDYLNKKKK
jgi:RHS repeat-associated protein